MMRMSSTYHLYKIALLVKTADAVKDSVILRPDEPSKALYFIVSGTVEVIQVCSHDDQRESLKLSASVNVDAGFRAALAVKGRWAFHSFSS